MSETPYNTRRNPLLFLGFVLAVWSVTGCAIGRTYEGSPLPENTPQSLVSGQTTRSDVLQKLGPPQEIFPQKTGYIYLYRYTQTNDFLLILQEPVFSRKVFFKFEKATEKSDSLVILFTPDGIVQSYGWGKDTPNLPFL